MGEDNQDIQVTDHQFGGEETPVEESEKRFTKEDILKASDVGEALTAYQAISKERGRNMPYDVMFALGERLLKLGDTESAMKFTILGEQARMAQIYERNNGELRVNVSGLGERIHRVEGAAFNMEKVEKRIDESTSQLERVSGRVAGTAEGLSNTNRALERSVDRAGEVVSKMSSASATANGAADRINAAADRVRRQGF